jgi:hypothetical protein
LRRNERVPAFCCLLVPRKESLRKLAHSFARLLPYADGLDVSMSLSRFLLAHRPLPAPSKLHPPISATAGIHCTQMTSCDEAHSSSRTVPIRRWMEITTGYRANNSGALANPDPLSSSMTLSDTAQAALWLLGPGSILLVQRGGWRVREPRIVPFAR